jgi:hypothetical protein
MREVKEKKNLPLLPGNLIFSQTPVTVAQAHFGMAVGSFPSSPDFEG